MTEKYSGKLQFFFVFVLFGFLVGLTGVVAATPSNVLEVDRQPELVYNVGLRQPAPAPAPALQEEPANEGETVTVVDLTQLGANAFSMRGCIQCHGIASLGIAGGFMGPDLSNTAVQVPDRIGISLSEFMESPQGLMVEVLRGADLSEQEREGIVVFLEGALVP